MPHAPRDAFTDEEWTLLLRHGRKLSDLVAGAREPRTEAQRDFVRFARAGEGDGGPMGELWARYLRVRRTPLTLELVPRTSWFANVRSAVSGGAWDRLRRAAYAGAGHRCQVCAGRGTRHAVEAHEIFEYDDASRVQRLVGLVTLCPACHACKHIGLAAVQGRFERALLHLARVNAWTDADARLYVEAELERWARRSAHPWTVDLSWLEAQGVHPREGQ